MLAAAIGAATSVPAAAQQLAAEVLVDRHLTVGAGASISAGIGEVVAHAEEKVIPDRLFAERGGLQRTASVTYRLFKSAFFDVPQERVLLVLDHEVFGHGARLRERFKGPIEYTFSLPQPYGRGGAATTYVFDREPTPWEQLAISSAGMESTTVVASIVAERAFVNGSMQPRDALRYLEFEFDAPRYIASTGREGREPGHDVGDFLRTYNDLASAAGASALTADQLRRETLVSLVNPMAAFAAFGIARYWWNGATDVRVPALSFAGVRYLPLMRYRLTPFGTEWALVNALGGRVRPMEVELRVGRSPHDTPWGISFRQRDLAHLAGWTFDAAMDMWRQPPVDSTDARRITFDPRVGARVRGRVSHRFTPASGTTFIVEMGVKSGGYVPGEPLRGGIVARAGVGIPVP